MLTLLVGDSGIIAVEMLLDEFRVVVVTPTVPEIGIGERNLITRTSRAHDRQVEPLVVEVQIEPIDEPRVGVADDTLIVGIDTLVTVQVSVFQVAHARFLIENLHGRLSDLLLGGEFAQIDVAAIGIERRSATA